VAGEDVCEKQITLRKWTPVQIREDELPSEHLGAAGQRRKAARMRPVENDTLLRETVEIWRAHLAAAVAAQVVSPESVADDDDDVH
jgi:hypothetical protein